MSDRGVSRPAVSSRSVDVSSVTSTVTLDEVGSMFKFVISTATGPYRPVPEPLIARRSASNAICGDTLWSKRKWALAVSPCSGPPPTTLALLPNLMVNSSVRSKSTSCSTATVSRRRSAAAKPLTVNAPGTTVRSMRKIAPPTSVKTSKPLTELPAALISSARSPAVCAGKPVEGTLASRSTEKVLTPSRSATTRSGAASPVVPT